MLARGSSDEVGRTLRAIVDGAVHDRLGGGFHRYAVDADWRIPHFEKVTDDNALLAVTLVDASIASGDPSFAAVARETLDALGQFALPDGGYGTGTDADSPGPDTRLVEGFAYTWTPAELAAALGPDGPRAAEALGVGGDAAIDGRWALIGTVDPAWRGPLTEARARRAAPQLDGKWVVATNARVVSAFARAGATLGDRALVDRAREAAERILREGGLPDGRMRHVAGSDDPGLLEDQALTATAWLDLLEATGDPAWLDAAVALMAGIDARYADPAGGWYRTPDDRPTPLYRPRDDADVVGPSGLSATVLACLRLAELTGDPAWTAKADRALSARARDLGPRFPALIEAAARRSAPGPVVVVGWPDGGDGGAVLAAVRSTWSPGRVVLAGPASTLAALGAKLPVVAGKDPGSAPTAWVCRSGVCQAPSTTADAVRAAMAAAGPR
jgi:uncharacterized protein YyaL (SSP411 family)